MKRKTIQQTNALTSYPLLTICLSDLGTSNESNEYGIRTTGYAERA